MGESSMSMSDGHSMGREATVHDVIKYVTSPTFCQVPWDAVTMSVSKGSDPQGKKSIVHIHRASAGKKNVFDIKFHNCQDEKCDDKSCVKRCHKINTTKDRREPEGRETTPCKSDGQVRTSLPKDLESLTDKKHKFSNDQINFTCNSLLEQIKSSPSRKRGKSFINSSELKEGGKKLNLILKKKLKSQDPLSEQLERLKLYNTSNDDILLSKNEGFKKNFGYKKKKREVASLKSSEELKPSCTLHIINNGKRKALHFDLHPAIEVFLLRAINRIEEQSKKVAKKNKKQKVKIDKFEKCIPIHKTKKELNVKKQFNSSSKSMVEDDPSLSTLTSEPKSVEEDRRNRQIVEKEELDETSCDSQFKSEESSVGLIKKESVASKPVLIKSDSKHVVPVRQKSQNSPESSNETEFENVETESDKVKIENKKDTIDNSGPTRPELVHVTRNEDCYCKCTRKRSPSPKLPQTNKVHSKTLEHEVPETDNGNGGISPKNLRSNSPDRVQQVRSSCCRCGNECQKLSTTDSSSSEESNNNLLSAKSNSKYVPPYPTVNEKAKGKNPCANIFGCGKSHYNPETHYQHYCTNGIGESTNEDKTSSDDTPNYHLHEKLYDRNAHKMFAFQECTNPLCKNPSCRNFTRSGTCGDSVSPTWQSRDSVRLEERYCSMDIRDRLARSPLRTDYFEIKNRPPTINYEKHLNFDTRRINSNKSRDVKTFLKVEDKNKDPYLQEHIAYPMFTTSKNSAVFMHKKPAYNTSSESTEDSILSNFSRLTSEGMFNSQSKQLINSSTSIPRVNNGESNIKAVKSILKVKEYDYGRGPKSPNCSEVHFEEDKKAESAIHFVRSNDSIKRSVRFDFSNQSEMITPTITNKRNHIKSSSDPYYKKDFSNRKENLSVGRFDDQSEHEINVQNQNYMNRFDTSILQNNANEGNLSRNNLNIINRLNPSQILQPDNNSNDVYFSQVNSNVSDVSGTTATASRFNNNGNTSSGNISNNMDRFSSPHVLHSVNNENSLIENMNGVNQYNNIGSIPPNGSNERNLPQDKANMSRFTDTIPYNGLRQENVKVIKQSYRNASFFHDENTNNSNRFINAPTIVRDNKDDNSSVNNPNMTSRYEFLNSRDTDNKGNPNISFKRFNNIRNINKKENVCQDYSHKLNNNSFITLNGNVEDNFGGVIPNNMERSVLQNGNFQRNIVRKNVSKMNHFTITTFQNVNIEGNLGNDLQNNMESCNISSVHQSGNMQRNVCWENPSAMKHFSKITFQNVSIEGDIVRESQNDEEPFCNNSAVHQSGIIEKKNEDNGSRSNTKHIKTDFENVNIEGIRSNGNIKRDIDRQNHNHFNSVPPIQQNFGIEGYSNRNNPNCMKTFNNNTSLFCTDNIDGNFSREYRNNMRQINTASIIDNEKKISQKDGSSADLLNHAVFAGNKEKKREDDLMFFPDSRGDNGNFLGSRKYENSDFANPVEGIYKKNKYSSSYLHETKMLPENRTNGILKSKSRNLSSMQNSDHYMEQNNRKCMINPGSENYVESRSPAYVYPVFHKQSSYEEEQKSKRDEATNTDRVLTNSLALKSIPSFNIKKTNFRPTNYENGINKNLSRHRVKFNQTTHETRSQGKPIISDVMPSYTVGRGQSSSSQLSFLEAERSVSSGENSLSESGLSRNWVTQIAKKRNKKRGKKKKKSQKSPRSKSHEGSMEVTRLPLDYFPNGGSLSRTMAEDPSRPRSSSGKEESETKGSLNETLAFNFENRGMTQNGRQYANRKFVGRNGPTGLAGSKKYSDTCKTLLPKLLPCVQGEAANTFKGSSVRNVIKSEVRGNLKTREEECLNNNRRNHVTTCAAARSPPKKGNVFQEHPLGKKPSDIFILKGSQNEARRKMDVSPTKRTSDLFISNKNFRANRPNISNNLRTENMQENFERSFLNRIGILEKQEHKIVSKSTCPLSLNEKKKYIKEMLRRSENFRKERGKSGGRSGFDSTFMGDECRRDNATEIVNRGREDKKYVGKNQERMDPEMNQEMIVPSPSTQHQIQESRHAARKFYMKRMNRWRRQNPRGVLDRAPSLEIDEKNWQLARDESRGLGPENYTDGWFQDPTLNPQSGFSPNMSHL